MNPVAATLALLMASIAMATTCTLYCALDLRFRFTAYSRVLSFMFGLLLVLQASLVGIQAATPRPVYFTLGYQVLVLCACGLLACSLLFNRYLFSDLIGVLVCGVDAVLLVLAMMLRHPALSESVLGGGGPPGLRWLLYLHVAAIVLSYVVLTLASISALAYLLRARGLKQKRRTRLLDSLPPLATLEAFTNRFVLSGFALLTAGIVVSQVFVVVSHRHGNFFDGRESLALLSWGVYAGYAAVRLVMRWEGRRLAFLVIAGYAVGLAPAAVLTSLGGARPL
ncbi:MAG: cytochrome c biogenesis protein CcsA [Candidatus Dormibacteria bacterium]